VQLGAVHLPRVARVVLRRALELLHGQRDKPLSVLALHVGCLLKGGRIRAAQKLPHVRDGSVASVSRAGWFGDGKRSEEVITFFQLSHANPDRKMAMFCDHRAAKERARFQADFAVTVKVPQWQCSLKFKPSFELIIVLLDSPGRYHAYNCFYRQTKDVRDQNRYFLKPIS
jgi:hypothetical protein